jgi:hypothetical protein
MARIREPRNARTQQDRRALKLALTPWKIDAVWAPLERMLARLELDGTVDTAMGKPVLHDDANRGWYEIAPAIEGIAQFHEIAATRHGWQIDLRPLHKLAAKLRHGSPVFAADIAAVRVCADQCKRHAMQMTGREAEDVLQTVRISIQMEQATA